MKLYQIHKDTFIFINIALHQKGLNPQDFYFYEYKMDQVSTRLIDEKNSRHLTIATQDIKKIAEKFKKVYHY